jgi:hypothetical protein
MKKRGQLLSQPFFYIFAVIVIGLTVLFGYPLIVKLLATECIVENNEFLNETKSLLAGNMHFSLDNIS